jgi:hypothetical protein
MRAVRNTRQYKAQPFLNSCSDTTTAYATSHLPLPRKLLFTLPFKMKIVVTGSTGWVGNAVLRECLSTPAITSVVSISRRDPGIKDEKLTTILHEDFSNYPDAIVEKIKAATPVYIALGPIFQSSPLS